MLWDHLTRVLLAGAILSLLGGCERIFVPRSGDGPAISEEAFQQLSPTAQAAYLEQAGLTPEVADLISKGELPLEAVLGAISPWASMLPYGGIILGLIGGALETWRRVKPKLVALRETSAGLDKLHETGNATTWDEVKSFLRDAQSTETKAVIAANRG